MGNVFVFYALNRRAAKTNSTYWEYKCGLLPKELMASGHPFFADLAALRGIRWTDKEGRDKKGLVIYTSDTMPAEYSAKFPFFWYETTKEELEKLRPILAEFSFDVTPAETTDGLRLAQEEVCKLRTENANLKNELAKIEALLLDAKTRIKGYEDEEKEDLKEEEHMDKHMKK